MTRVAVLGLGAMGRRMAERLVAAKLDVVTWTRSTATDAPRAAAAGADVVLSMLTDDRACREVWLTPDTGALFGLRAGSIAIESSTTTPAWALELRARVLDRGAEFLEAPVVGSRPQAEAGALVFLAGGAASSVERARPVLQAMGSTVHHVGETPAGAAAKLVANALFASQVAMLAELLAGSLDPHRTLEALAPLPIMSPAAKTAGTAMLEKRFDPMFPLALVEKDIRYALAGGSALPMTTQLLDVVSRANARGLAELNITALAKLYER